MRLYVSVHEDCVYFHTRFLDFLNDFIGYLRRPHIQHGCHEGLSYSFPAFMKDFANLLKGFVNFLVDLRDFLNNSVGSSRKHALINVRIYPQIHRPQAQVHLLKFKRFVSCPCTLSKSQYFLSTSPCSDQTS